MDNFYGQQHLALQAVFSSRELGKRVQESIVVPEFTDAHRAFIEQRDMFFLSTIDHRGYPTCSYKGGNPGFVKVLDAKTLAFPSYDGNGMFLSMGNIVANNKIGMLFIDFETPQRVRVHGEAKVLLDGPLMEMFPAADLVVQVALTEAFVNCPRYIHKYQRVATSKYVPQPDKNAPIPEWKRIEGLQEALPEHERQAVEAMGTITPEEYAELVMKGEG
ncbi:MAG TPA: pyridoxamine 5'-phosphate oxidase family protein [Methylophilaceae bacterium]|nr:pyridoxamine 5'-phosphate oxidase family protein [Methylophilaceae bacterium]